MREIKVIELFAGVGGFRIGLERASSSYKVVWSNQWEPSSKKQDASEIYVRRFGNVGHCNEDISTVPIENIPDHDLLVGGFPCQDYSVATTLKRSGGLEGKKGVLWWEIYRIIKEKKVKPQYLFLENVDRLLKSPANQRGRDFAIMLASLSDLGYIVEWRVINAADYGMPQRRRRIFILAYQSSSLIHQQVASYEKPMEWLIHDGLFAESFEVCEPKKLFPNEFMIKGDLADISNNFNLAENKTPFKNSGIIRDRKVFTIDTEPNYQGDRTTLGNIILLNGSVPEEFYINEEHLEKWTYLKGAKSAERMNKTHGFKYNYSEGAMVFPDPLERPSRTIITGEGGSTPSRFKHVIKTAEGRLRRLTPVELERLNMFPDHHTEGVSDIKRAFLMGNALVIGIVEKVGNTLIKRISQ